MRRRQAGLTLIELLIAMSLMALLTILGYRAFASMLIARERLMTTGSQWNDLARAFSQVERDLAMLPSGQAGSAVALQQGLLQVLLPSTTVPDGKELRQYRTASAGLSWGWGHPASAVIAYYPLLEAPAVHWQVGAQDGSWHERWPEGNGKPILLKLIVQLNDGQKVERLWALP